MYTTDTKIYDVQERFFNKRIQYMKQQYEYFISHDNNKLF